MILKKKFTLICGHYGCGKTNLSLNLAKDCALSGDKVTLVDLDLVNPYFRSSDYGQNLYQLGVRLISPVFANSNVDVPSLPAELYSIFDTENTVIIDVGGDDVGATVLGRIQAQINALDYDMLYVINQYRNLTMNAEECVDILNQIQTVSRCRATAIVNNSHLKQETTTKTILDSFEFAERVSTQLNLPLRAVTVPEQLEDELRSRCIKNERKELIYPVHIFVTTPWE